MSSECRSRCDCTQRAGDTAAIIHRAWEGAGQEHWVWLGNYLAAHTATALQLIRSSEELRQFVSGISLLLSFPDKVWVVGDGHTHTVRPQDRSQPAWKTPLASWSPTLVKQPMAHPVVPRTPPGTVTPPRPCQPIPMSHQYFCEQIHPGPTKPLLVLLSWEKRHRKALQDTARLCISTGGSW